MILRNLFGARALQYSFSTQLRWKTNPNGVEIFYQQPKFKQKLVFYATVNIKVSQFLTAFGIKQKDVIYPEGVNPQSDLITFLLQRENAKAIEIKHHGENLFLRNRAWQHIYQQPQSTPGIKQLITVIRDPHSIYQHLLSFNSTHHPKYFIQRCNYLTRYYLKLQSQCYCRVKKINTHELLTNKIKDDIINYLNFKNQTNCQQLIQDALKEEVQIHQQIRQTQQLINQINATYLARQAWYKNLAVLITAVHLFSFGYMIFAVDWLGWDIIEPLTYSAGVVYTLLGIRFYRKYKMDRSAKNVKQALFNFIMPIEKRNSLKEITQRLLIQQQQLKRKQQQQVILKNRLAFKTSLINSIQNTLLK